MIGSALTKIFGSKNERVLKAIQPLVERINSFEPDIQKLDDAALAAKTIAFKERIAKGESLDDLLPEAFAVTREAARRVIGERHYDVQLVGGVILHQGKIAEMKTGEGKTLCSTLAVYLNALSGKGVHVVTVNDYLARRDAEWMGAIYRFLGLTTGTIVHEMNDQERQEAYNADVENYNEERVAEVSAAELGMIPLAAQAPMPDWTEALEALDLLESDLAKFLETFFLETEDKVSKGLFSVTSR